MVGGGGGGVGGCNHIIRVTPEPETVTNKKFPGNTEKFCNFVLEQTLLAALKM